MVRLEEQLNNIIYDIKRKPLLRDRFDLICETVRNKSMDFSDYQVVAEFFNKHKSKYFTKTEEGLNLKQEFRTDYQESAALSGNRLLQMLENKKTETNQMPEELGLMLRGKNGSHYWVNRCDNLKEYIDSRELNPDLLKYISNYLDKNVRKFTDDIGNEEKNKLKVEKISSLKDYVDNRMNESVQKDYIHSKNGVVRKVNPELDLSPVRIIGKDGSVRFPKQKDRLSVVIKHGTYKGLFSGFQRIKAWFFNSYRQRLTQSLDNLKSCSGNYAVLEIYNNLPREELQYYPKIERLYLNA